MEPQEPVDDSGITIGTVDALLLSSQPSEKRGESTTLEIVLQHLPEDRPKSLRYQTLKQYQQYAGEAVYGTVLGGDAYFREHPQEYWDQASHVVPVVTGDDVHEIRDFWGVITNVDDSDTTIIGEPDEAIIGGGYGEDYGASYGGEIVGSTQTDNHYQLSIEIVPVGDVEEFADREDVFADLSPPLNQM